MRLWHQFLIPLLDDKRLLGQHRECCALRGKGWGKKHSVVDYVFKHDPGMLYEYHVEVMHEMLKRGMLPGSKWYCRTYRGKNLSETPVADVCKSYVYNSAFAKQLIFMSFLDFVHMMKAGDSHLLIYPEHDLAYLKECLLNLKSKGAKLKGPISIEEMLVEIDLALDS